MDINAILGFLVFYILPIGFFARDKIKEGANIIISILSSIVLITSVWALFFLNFYITGEIYDLLKTFDLPTFIFGLLVFIVICIAAYVFVMSLIIIGNTIEKVIDKFSNKKK